jgi:23S rRNA pseudouridine1911/1915/1917 synthase
MIYKFTADSPGLILASFLKEALGDAFSQKGIKKAIEKGACRVNKRVMNYANHKLIKGDVVEISLENTVEVTPKIIFDDPEFLIIDKPSGVISEEKSLKKFFSFPIYLVHRLDKETSGLLILAKNYKIKNYFEDLFRQKKIKKKYLAICDGLITHDHGIIEASLEETKVGHNTVTVKVNPHSPSKAVTLWKKLGSGKNVTFMEFEIITGKTHQIRVHASHIGHPVMGDPIYLKKPLCTFIPESLCLHSFFLSFKHPSTEEEVVVSKSPPKYFMDALKTLIPNAKLPRH